jgi:hypothetical protein
MFSRILTKIMPNSSFNEHGIVADGTCALSSRPAILALTLAATLSACGAAAPVSRGQGVDGLTLATSGARNVVPIYTVDAVDITVPHSLTVSEANSYLPLADIVWRGEPPGNRYAQVASILADGLRAGTIDMKQGPRVTVEVVLTRFHALTEKARYTVGGNHAIHFELTVRDAATGAILDGPRMVVADVKASGGARALAEEQMGRTQRVVIVERLSQIIQRELTTPPSAGLVPS